MMMVNDRLFLTFGSSSRSFSETDSLFASSHGSGRENERTLKLTKMKEAKDRDKQKKSPGGEEQEETRKVPIVSVAAKRRESCQRV